MAQLNVSVRVGDDTFFLLAGRTYKAAKSFIKIVGGQELEFDLGGLFTFEDVAEKRGEKYYIFTSFKYDTKIILRMGEVSEFIDCRREG